MGTDNPAWQDIPSLDSFSKLSESDRVLNTLEPHQRFQPRFALPARIPSPHRHHSGAVALMNSISLGLSWLECRCLSG